MDFDFPSTDAATLPRDITLRLVPNRARRVKAPGTCSYRESSATNSGKWRFNETESVNRQHDIEPYWQDEDDWLCTVEFLRGDNPEGRLSGADIVG